MPNDNNSALGALICRVLMQIGELDKNSVDEIMFRGQSSNHSLLPSLLRLNRNYIKENNLYCDSWIMAGKELSGRNSWENLAHLQHYGIPTRLLDWTSSLIRAIYFAISNCHKCDGLKDCNSSKEKCVSNPCIWVLNPRAMHETIHESVNSVCDKSAITIGIDNFPEYVDYFIKQDGNRWKFKNGPIFIEVPWLSARISSQKGYFTFHPTDLDLSKRKYSEIKKFLRKVEIKHDEIQLLMREMRIIGINEFDIYQDLMSLGSYLKKKIE